MLNSLEARERSIYAWLKGDNIKHTTNRHNKNPKRGYGMGGGSGDSPRITKIILEFKSFPKLFDFTGVRILLQSQGLGESGHL